MEFNDLEMMCERAGRYTFSRAKFFMTAIALLGAVFLVAVSLLFSYLPTLWGSMSPFLLLMLGFFCILLSLGVALISSYHDEVKKKPISHSHILLHTYRVLLKAAPLLFPVLLALAGLWIVEGAFTLLQQVPYIGAVIQLVTSFVPFIWMLLLLALTLVVLYLLFTVTPILALRSVSKEDLLPYVEAEIRESIFVRLFLFIVGILPLIIVEKFLVAAVKWVNFSAGTAMRTESPLLQSLFFLVPAALIITPTIIFFFNMAAEAHVFVQKRTR